MLSKARPFKIYQFNVGLGEHLLLELPYGSFGIIDFNYAPGKLRNQFVPPAMDILAQKLKERRKRGRKLKIAFIHISHADKNHIKGLDVFLDWLEENESDIELGNIWLFPSIDIDTRLRQLRNAAIQIMKEAEDIGEQDLVDRIRIELDQLVTPLKSLREFVKKKKNESKVEYCVGINKLSKSLMGRVSACVMAPREDRLKRYNNYLWEDFALSVVRSLRLDEEKISGLEELSNVISNVGKSQADKNRASAILKISYKKFTAIFGSDTGINVWRDSLNEYTKNDFIKRFGSIVANFIKVSQHGSKHSSSLNLWKAILHPLGSYIAILPGRHKISPDRETLDHINEAALEKGFEAKVYSTYSYKGSRLASEKELTLKNTAWIKKEPSLIGLKTMEAIRNSGPRNKNQLQKPGDIVSQDKLLLAHIFEFYKTNKVKIRLCYAS